MRIALAGARALGGALAGFLETSGSYEIVLCTPRAPAEVDGNLARRRPRLLPPPASRLCQFPAR